MDRKRTGSTGIGAGPRRDARGWIIGVILPLLIVAMAPLRPAGAAAASVSPGSSGPNLGPSPYKCGIGCWADLPNSLAVSYLADVDVSPKIVHPGDIMMGHIKLFSSFQTKKASGQTTGIIGGFEWLVGGTAVRGCGFRSLTCSWRAGAATDKWSTVTLVIYNSINSAESQDYYAVVGKNTHVVDGYVRDSAGAGMRGVPMWVSGISNSTAYHPSTDGNGFYYAFVTPGTYSVRVDVPAANVQSRFSPSRTTVSLGVHASADFSGEDHLVVKVDKRTVEPDGRGMATVTASEYDPFGRAVPNQLIKLDVTGPPSVVCSAMPNHVGYLEPSGVFGPGKPVYASAFQRTDSTGVLSDTVYFGTESGTWTVLADDAAHAKASPTGVTSPLFASADVTIKTGTWLPAVPSSFRTPLYFDLVPKGPQGTPTYVAVQTTVTWDLSHLIWGALHRLTFPAGTAKILNVPGASATSSLILGNDPLGNQKALLRWAEAHLPVGHELEVAPISGPGSKNAAVVIYAHHHPLAADSRVLDTDEVTRMVNAQTWATSPDGLPTVSEWETQIGGTAVLDYALPTPERDRTYLGFPYLPVANADDPRQEDPTFAACLQQPAP